MVPCRIGPEPVPRPLSNRLGSNRDKPEIGTPFFSNSLRGVPRHLRTTSEYLFRIDVRSFLCKVPLKIRAKGPGQFKSNASIGQSSMECWNDADMDVSGGILAHLVHAGNR